MANPSKAPARWRDPGRQLWVVAGLCWLVLLLSGHRHDAGAAASVAGRLFALLSVLGAWMVMTAAMMLPTVVPMVRMFHVVSARGPHPAAVRAAFLAGYLSLWTGFAVVAVALAAGLQALAHAGWLGPLGTHPDLLLAAMLAVAGVFQLTPLKDRCLTECRDPRAFLFANYRRGVRGGWRLGLRHGVSCLGCCWALMLIMAGTGLSNIAVMLALTAVMVIEKTARFGHRLVVPVGVGLLAAAAAVAVFGTGPFADGPPPGHQPAGVHHH